jgi:dGTPase
MIGGQLPRYRNLIGCGEDKTQVVCDYIAGMTDQYSMHKYAELFVPKAWAVY